MNPWRKVAGSENTPSGKGRGAGPGGLAGPPRPAPGRVGTWPTVGQLLALGQGRWAAGHQTPPSQPPAHVDAPHNPPASTCGSGGVGGCPDARKRGPAWEATRHTHWAPAGARPAARQLLTQAPRPRLPTPFATGPAGSWLHHLGPHLGGHFPQEDMRPKLPCWKAPGPLVSHTSQTRKPGEKPPTSRDFGQVDPRLSRGSGQHLRPLGRAARRGRTGRCASRVQGTASSGWGWGE